MQPVARETINVSTRLGVISWSNHWNVNRKYGSASAVHQTPINPTNRIYTRRICLWRTQNTLSDFLKLRNNCVIETVKRKFLQDVIRIDNESSCHDADQKLKCVITTHRFLLEGFAYKWDLVARACKIEAKCVATWRRTSMMTTSSLVPGSSFFLAINSRLISAVGWFPENRKQVNRNWQMIDFSLPIY